MKQPITQIADHLLLNGMIHNAPHEEESIVLLLGNAYGILPYQIPLANALHERGHEVWWFSFQGQDGVVGTFSGENGVFDIDTAVNHLVSNRKYAQISILAHCTSSLMAIEYLRRNPNSPIGKLIVYGLLANPRRRWDYAKKRLEAYNVKVSVSESDLSFDPAEAIREIDIPVLFCHAEDQTNMARATREELQKVVHASPNGQLKWFKIGYDKSLDSLLSFAEAYDNWLTGTKTENRLENKVLEM